MLLVVVVDEAEARRQAVECAELTLHHQLGVEALLRDVVELVPILGRLIVVDAIGDEGNIGAVGRVENEGVLLVELVVVIVEAYLVALQSRGHHMSELAAAAFLAEA